MKLSKSTIKKSKRIGRGPSSKRGKTSCRGQHGQNARHRVSSRFSTTSFFKKIPKYGFTNVHKRKIYTISSFSIDRYLSNKECDRLDKNDMIKIFNVPKNHDIKIIGKNIDGRIKSIYWDFISKQMSYFFKSVNVTNEKNNA